MVWKIILPHYVTSFECYYFITHMHSCVMGIGATPMNCISAFVHAFSLVCIVVVFFSCHVFVCGL